MVRGHRIYRLFGKCDKTIMGILEGDNKDLQKQDEDEKKKGVTNDSPE